jgi:hypothetical protein
LPPETVEGYVRFLVHEGVGLDALILGCDRVIRTARFFPTMAELLEAIGEAQRAKRVEAARLRHAEMMEASGLGAPSPEPELTEGERQDALRRIEELKAGLRRPAIEAATAPERAGDATGGGGTTTTTPGSSTSPTDSQEEAA